MPNINNINRDIDIKIDSVHMNIHCFDEVSISTNEDFNPEKKNYYQIIYINHGNGYINSNKVRYNIKSGDFLLLTRDVKYSIKATKQSIKYYNISFLYTFDNTEALISKDSENGFEQVIINMSSIKNIFGIPDKAKCIHRIFEDIIQELKSNKLYIKQILSFKILNLITCVLSILREDGSNFISNLEYNTNEQIVTVFKNMIQKDAVTHNSIPDICKKLKISFRQLNRLLKEYEGYTAQSFINRILIIKALEMYRINEISLKKIASTLGFCNEYYLSNIIKKETGATPILLNMSKPQNIIRNPYFRADNNDEWLEYHDVFYVEEATPQDRSIHIGPGRGGVVQIINDYMKSGNMCILSAFGKINNINEVGYFGVNVFDYSDKIVETHQLIFETDEYTLRKIYFVIPEKIKRVEIYIWKEPGVSIF